jgi:hypothetical protein
VTKEQLPFLYYLLPTLESTSPIQSTKAKGKREFAEELRRGPFKDTISSSLPTFYPSEEARGQLTSSAPAGEGKKKGVLHLYCIYL